MSTDFQAGYLTGQAHLEGEQAFRRLLNRQMRRMQGFHPDPAVQAIAEWAQQNAALQAQVEMLRAEIDGLVAENAKLRKVVHLGDIAIKETVERAGELQAQLLRLQVEASKRQGLLEDTQRRLYDALHPDDCL